ncbi:uncharacterized protein LOC129773622 [Toxorhynchites rutilus septentrionalis]|uniref:uncharacterized protein LOC129773622 n=1 Tax=Toxorhynchites rutilus septentrionalis TaxID=329112 RepID=UPI002479DAFE|nr:uncharacterized protein LOC129773622 [Toxorhynchites rutilus septentrionalis]
MGLSCEINFPYNWSRDFYCGEMLNISVELNCPKEMTIQAITLNVSCSSRRNQESFTFSRYIDDRDSEVEAENTRNTEGSAPQTNIDLLNGNGCPIMLAPGTYVFEVECQLPEMSVEHVSDDDKVGEYNFTIRVQKAPKTDCEKQKCMSVCDLLSAISRKEITFVWPDEFVHISNFSIASAIVSWYYVSKIASQNNRHCSSECENDCLENWLEPIIGIPDEEDGGS